MIWADGKPLASSDKPDRKKRARHWLTKGSMAREDSDDELGYEDHPWEWIYVAENKGNRNENLSLDRANSKSTRDSGRLRVPKKIVGARMGNFECRLGQVVLLKSPEAGKDWAGIICEFLEVEDEDQDDMVKSANIMWLASPDEFISTKNKKRVDALPNEQYLTTDFNVNPLSSINGRAHVMSKDAFFRKYPNGNPPRGRVALAEYKKCIICRRSVNQLKGKYTEEFIWEDVYQEDEQTVFDLIDMATSRLKSSKKRKPMDKDDVDNMDDNGAPTTPKKKQKMTSLSNTTPKSQRQKLPTTPTSKRIVIKKPLEFTPLRTRVLSPSHFTSSPYRQARAVLHVSSVPSSLPCRAAEFETVYTHLSAAITEGTGTCIYISGTPGTGKTATVREVVSQLNAAVLAEEMDDFVFVEINGMKVTDPHQAYSLLWEALKGDRVAPSHALNLLETDFSQPSPRRVPCVVLMDELDQLVTKNQSVMYNFFNWPALRHSRLIVLAVANTMDLPERTLSNKISSRLGLTRITFPGYKHTDLMEIISSRLEDVPGSIVDPDAIQFASRKVAAVSGDARRALDICRRAVEIAEEESEEIARTSVTNQACAVDTASTRPSKQPSRRQKAARQKQQKSRSDSPQSKEATLLPRVTIATVKQAIQEATSTPLQQSLKSLPLSAKVFLAALLARVRRTGISESTIGDVLDEAKRIADAAVAVAGIAGANLKEFLLKGVYGPRVRAMGFAAMELMSSGVVILETGIGKGVGCLARGDRSGKVRLRVSAEDVKAAFRDDAEAKGLWLGFDQ